MRESQMAYQNEHLLDKKFFDSMVSLESDKMTALWWNDCLNSTFYEAFSFCIPNWKTFCITNWKTFINGVFEFGRNDKHGGAAAQWVYRTRVHLRWWKMFGYLTTL